MKRDTFKAASMVLAAQSISSDVLSEKYFKGSESSAEEIYQRVAGALASVESTDHELWRERFLANLRLGAIGAGRIMSAAGTDLEATLINCFVQPVGDSIQGVDKDGYPGIYEALREAAETMRRGGGVGYDFSRIRPRGAAVRTTHSLASGPCSYMNVFDQSCGTVESAGSRRGAQMGVLRIDHPDILEFVGAKRTPGRWNNFNVSVAVPDAFMRAVTDDLDWPLLHPAAASESLIAAGAHQRADGQWVYRSVKARELWDTVMRSAYDYAEPGILFIDRINADNNLRYCEHIAATNPCGEQPLPSYGCCDLGPVILSNFVHHPFGISGTPSFDFAAFSQSVELQVRALDNVLDLTYWPLPEQRAEAHDKRRIGVGFTALGSTLLMLKLHYDSDAAREMAAQIARQMRDSAYRASISLAKEKGQFKRFDADGYLTEGTFASRLPSDIQQDIRRFGIRNSHLLSIAPTGTVSLAFADNASNGIEPSFSWTYQRKKRAADGSFQSYLVEDHGWRLYRALGGDTAILPDYFVSALELASHGHVAMMQAVQPFIDTSISKTVNVPQHETYDGFKDLYRMAFDAGLKGLATFRPNDILGSILAPATADSDASDVADQVDGSKVPISSASDPMREVIASRPRGALAAVAEKIEYWTQEGHRTLYLIVSFLPVAAHDGSTVERAIEFFMPVGQSAESQQWITASMRLLSLAARGGFLERALSDMRKVAWDRGPVRLGTYQKENGTLVPRWHDSEVSAIAYAVQNIIASHAAPELPLSQPVSLFSEAAVPASSPMILKGKKCPECGAHAVIRKDGCDHCTQCGFMGSCG
jgi:ribonucleoside-diphosphate reductase alpha chain